MAHTVQQFLDQLAASGILSQTDLQALKETLGSDTTDAVDAIDRELLRKWRVTPYQVEQLVKGKGRELVLDDYLILDVIGSGGMGNVYLAEHRRMERKVALKVLPPALMGDQRAVHRFCQEVKAAAKLSHPNIVTAYDAGQLDDVNFFVMEYVQGQDLAQLIKRRGPLRFGQAIQCVRQVAKGLEYAHRKGVIHRDIKPANLLVDSDGVVKILDMGLARTESEENGLTRSGVAMGTADFMAPEQGVNAKNANERSDIYSLGCTLFYLLTGKRLYGGDSLFEKIMAHQNQEIPPLKEIFPQASSEIADVFQKMVAKRPTDRQQTATDLLRELDNVPEARGVHDGVLSNLLPPRLAEGESDPADATAMFQSSHAEGEKPDTFVSAIGDDTQNDTLDNTDAANQRLAIESPDDDFRVPGASSRNIGRGLLIVGVIAALATIVVNWKTPAGIVVLEVDQPVLAGAQVLIDGEKKMVIQTGQGKESIEITPDAQKHELQVVMGGFETFTKEFSFATGSRQSIRVRLEPTPRSRSIGSNPRVSAPDQADPPALAAEMKTPDEASESSSSGEPPASQILAPDVAFATRLFELVEDQNGEDAYGNFVAIFEDSSRKQILSRKMLPTGRPFKIESLTLTGASLNGNDFQLIGRLDRLKYVTLDRSFVTNEGMKEIAKIPGLLSFSVANTPIGPNGLLALRDQTAMQRLDVSKTNVSGVGLSAVAEMTELQYLSLDGLPITDAALPSLQRLTKLETLYLSESHVASDLEPLKKLASLKWLRLSGSRIDDEGLSHLASLSSLEHLELASTSVTGAGLRNLVSLKRLKSLDVRNIQLDEDGCKALAQFPLTRLSLRGNAMEDQWLNHLLPLADTLTYLGVYDTGLTNDAVGILSQFKALETLEIGSGTKVTPSALESMRRSLPKARIN